MRNQEIWARIVRSIRANYDIFENKYTRKQLIEKAHDYAFEVFEGADPAMYATMPADEIAKDAKLWFELSNQ